MDVFSGVSFQKIELSVSEKWKILKVEYQSGQFFKNKLSTNFNVIQCYDIHEVNLELTVRNSNQTRNPYAQNSHITSTFYIISG